MSQLPIRAVSPDVCVAPQLTPAAMAELAAMGFKSVVNNRPDFEHGPDQPPSAAIHMWLTNFGQPWCMLAVQQPKFGSRPKRFDSGPLLVQG